MIGKLRQLATHSWARMLLVYGAGQVFNLVTPLLVVPYIVSVCGVTGLGKTAYGFYMALFLILIVDYAFEVKSMKRVAEHRDDLSVVDETAGYTFFTKALLFGLALMLALSAIAFVPFFAKDRLVFLLSLPIVMAQVVNPVWLLQGMERYGLVSTLNILSKTLYVGFVVVLIQTPGDYIYVNCLLGLSSLVCNIVMLWYACRIFGLRLPKPSFRQIRSILRHDFSFCISQLFLSIRQLSPLMLAGYILGDAMAGYYRIIEQFITLFRTLSQVYLRFFFPKSCFRYNQEPASGLALWRKYAAVLTVLAGLALFVVFVFAEPILHFFRLTASEVERLYPIFRPALIIPLLITISLSFEQLLFIMGRNRNYVKVTIFVTVTNVTLIALLTPVHGLLGIVGSLIICEILFISGYSFYSLFDMKNSSPSK